MTNGGLRIGCSFRRFAAAAFKTESMWANRSWRLQHITRHFMVQPRSRAACEAFEPNRSGYDATELARFAGLILEAVPPMSPFAPKREHSADRPVKNTPASGLRSMAAFVS